jgi:hypothetical protein
MQEMLRIEEIWTILVGYELVERSARPAVDGTIACTQYWDKHMATDIGDQEYWCELERVFQCVETKNSDG